MKQKVKQFVKQNRYSENINCYPSSDLGIIPARCQRSSGVEQRFRKPPVDGSNPFAGSIFQSYICSFPP